MGALGKKLLLHKAKSVLFMNEPDGYSTLLTDELAENTLILNEPSPTADFVLLFARDSRALKQWADTGLIPSQEGKIVWVAYPKKSSKVESDLSRDILVNLLNELGYQGVSLISLDETWSAMRIKPV